MPFHQHLTTLKFYLQLPFENTGLPFIKGAQASWSLINPHSTTCIRGNRCRFTCLLPVAPASPRCQPMIERIHSDPAVKQSTWSTHQLLGQVADLMSLPAERKGTLDGRLSHQVTRRLGWQDSRISATTRILLLPHPESRH